MPVFYRDNLKILYIHVPKTGGTAIELFFEANGFRTAYLDRGLNSDNLNPVMYCSPQHMEAAMLSKIFKLSAFDYVFMTIRDPIDRILSEYKHRIGEKLDLPDVNTWVRRLLRRYADEPYMLDNHLRPQADFWVERADVFRQEDGFGSDWIEQISSRIPCQFTTREVRRAMKFDVKAAEQADLSETSVAALRRFYHQDFVLFGYS